MIHIPSLFRHLLMCEVFFSTQVCSVTTIRMWTGRHFVTPVVHIDDIEIRGIIDLKEYNFANQISSYLVRNGSCVEMHIDNPPTYNHGTWFVATSYSKTMAGDPFEDKITVIKSCKKIKKDLVCPEGQFVKKIAWDGMMYLTNGIEIHCAVIESKTANSIFRTNGNTQLDRSMTCTGLRTISFGFNSVKESFNSMEAKCQTEAPAEMKFTCGLTEVMVAIRTVIEEHTNKIKSVTAECRDVGKMEKKCKPKDKLSVLFTCDSSEAQHTLKCTHATTVGFSESKSLSTERSIEKEFWYEFGFEVGAELPLGLSATFSASLGQSTTTGFAWTEATEKAFQSSVTVTVEAEAPAGCITKVHELVGYCSFLDVRPHYFKRVDNCKGGKARFVNSVDVRSQLAEMASRNAGGGNNILVIGTPEDVRKFVETGKR